jgi:RNA polymerase sigma factor (sigma-70 family)
MSKPDLSTDKKNVAARETRATLLERVRNPHDEGAWDEFVHVYRPYIATVVRNAGTSASDIDDMVQSVLLAAWEKLPDFEYSPEKGRFRYWLNTITIRAVRRHFQKSGRLKRALSGESAFKLDSYMQDSTRPEVEALAEQAWRVHLAKLAWERVREELAPSVLAACEQIVEGVTPKQIAVALDLKENSIHVYKRRVEKRLAQEIRRLKKEVEC